MDDENNDGMMDMDDDLGSSDLKKGSREGGVFDADNLFDEEDEEEGGEGEDEKGMGEFEEEEE
jgi:hypothetical protein